MNSIFSGTHQGRIHLIIGGPAAVVLALISGGCAGKALPFYPAPGFIGKPAVTSTGNGNLDPPKALFQVTQIIEAPAGGGIPGFTGTMPFNTYPVLTIGDTPQQNTQTAFDFTFSYPPNNFQLASANIVMDTSRDTTDTEGVFVDGVVSGRPYDGNVDNSSPYITHRTDHFSSAPQKNTYYIDWSLSHYKHGERNTFDLSISDLLTYTPLSPYDVLNDGYLPVVTADDSPVYQAYLVLKGYTVSSAALSCSTSPLYSFQNVFLHNDGNSIGTASFNGTVRNPYASWNNSRASDQSLEFYFDANWPKVDEQNVSITEGKLRLRVKRAASGTSAIVVNGVGVAESGFDVSRATSVVEEWVTSSAATSTWSSFVSSIPANETQTDVVLDLVAMLGATKLRSLIAQGKLNVAIAGSLAVAYGEELTSARSVGNQVQGPELILEGTYYTELCQVPNDPDSPLSGAAPTPPTVDDGTGPVISSLTIVEITSTSAKIMWLTDEPATSQVKYGLFDIDQSTPEDTTLSTFHEVTLTGLLPYKWYFVEVISKDTFGNQSDPLEEAVPFRTLR